MNFFTILTLILGAIATQSATLPITVGAKHFLVAINRQPTPGHTTWSDALSILTYILAGQPGTFTVGVFTITITELVPATP